MAAHAQGKFWLLHDKMFQNFNLISEENIKKWAREVGLNMADFEKAMQSGVLETQVQRDMADGATAGVLGTPTLFVNGKRIHDRSFEGFKKVILEEHATAKSPSVPPERPPRPGPPAGPASSFRLSARAPRSAGAVPRPRSARGRGAARP